MMGKSKTSQVTTFCLEGRFLGYQVEEGNKPKRLQLATAEGECSLKLTKEARFGLNQILVSGDWVQVSGRKKIDQATHLTKLKVDFIRPIVSRTAIAPIEPSSRQKPSEVILVCQKSGCTKRGGKAVCQALEMALSDRGLDDQVAIKGTGCMKNCGKGPNVVMPGKVRYCQIGAKEIPGLVDKHFPVSEPVEPIAESRELLPAR
ncbi:MAG: (2Fe-2S) ferredoxin domain-containing protein [Phormidesmis sp. CAN_BIN36]|nr:(2Fe-2S) ferredoxin domain-containing protein [Phormidesmis sp. CAN_BIN36]